MPSLDFYEGMMIALDSLKNQGLCINLFVYDTKGDTNVVKDIINNEKFSKTNLLIGPILPDEFSTASRSLKNKNIKQVSFFSNDNILLNDTNVSKFLPYETTCVKTMFDFMVNNYGKKNILIESSGMKRNF